MKVFILRYWGEWEDPIVGIFSSKELAIEYAKKDYVTLYTDDKKSYCVDECDIDKPESFKTMPRSIKL